MRREHTLAQGMPALLKGITWAHTRRRVIPARMRDMRRVVRETMHAAPAPLLRLFTLLHAARKKARSSHNEPNEIWFVVRRTAIRFANSFSGTTNAKLT